MPGVFINYRRQDSSGYAGRLFDRLQDRLGRDRVFMDVTGVDPGVDFAHAIERVLESCDLLLAVIGPDWLTCTDAKGQRRLDDPKDFVRLELTAALRRDVRVIPVLVGGASVPPPGALPDDLTPLSRRQTVELRDTRWDADSQSLIDKIAALLPADAPVAAAAGKRRLLWLVAAIVVAGAVAVPATRYLRTADPPSSAPPAADASIAERVLTYAVTTRSSASQDPSRAETQVAGDRIFATGDLIRLSFSSPQAGFLYLINESPPDRRGGTALNILFPSPSSNGGSARLAPDQDVRIPDTGEGFVFDAEAGVEKLWLVWSAARVDELDGLKRWANPADQGEIKDLRDIQTVRDFLIRHASPAPETREVAASARTVLKAPGDLFVKLVTLEHGPLTAVGRKGANQ